MVFVLLHPPVVKPALSPALAIAQLNFDQNRFQIHPVVCNEVLDQRQPDRRCSIPRLSQRTKCTATWGIWLNEENATSANLEAPPQGMGAPEEVRTGDLRPSYASRHSFLGALPEEQTQKRVEVE